MSDPTDLALEILADALDAPPDERVALIDKACTTQPALRAEIERLLSLEQRPGAGDFLNFPLLKTPQLGTGPGVEDNDGDPANNRFGRYRAIRLIAEGGMGTVYEARQDHPKRHVALKVIKPGMDTRQVIARFEAEREALALMDHPNIAAVYDAGITDTRRPFFVMELVKGVPITEYCDTNALPIRQRLDLFISVCKAVQHAHQKGIIHRDLKPSNVLVTMADGKPAPKVIDFGISKAIGGQRLTDHTLLTEYREFIGTPQYMSPEQAEMTRLDIDTRSDIYSLGVLLYELLTGVTPFDREQLTANDPEQMRRVIRETEPPRPSTRLNRLTDGDKDVVTAAAGSPRSSSHRATLAKTLRGELDWIVMKCLEKDRTRRYDTPNELAADLERYLRNEAVMAGPPSATYRLRKFVRRNRAPLVVAGVMVLLLVGGVAGTTVGMLHARSAQSKSLKEEQRALDGQRRATEAEAQARREARQATSLNEFLTELFRAARPGWAGGGRDVRVADLLDYAAVNLPGKFPGNPESEVIARMCLAGTYGHLGLQDDCVENFSLAYDLALKHFPEEHPLAMESGARLAYWMIQEFPSPALLDRSRSIATRVIHVAGTRTKEGEANPFAHMAAHALGWGSVQKREYAAAEQIFRRMLRVEQEYPEAMRITGTSSTHHGLAWALRSQGKLDEAEQHQRETLVLAASGSVTQRFPRQHIANRRILGLILADQQRFPEAAETLREALEVADDVGHRYPPVERVSNEYINVLVRLDDFPRAAEFARNRLDLALAENPVDHSVVAASARRLIKVLVYTWHDDDQLRAATARLRGALRQIARQPVQTYPQHTTRAFALAEAADFTDAAGAFDRCVQLNPDDVANWFYRGCILAYLNDRHAYDRHCRDALHRFAATPDVDPTDRLAKTYLLVPRSPEQLRSIANWLDRALANEAPNYRPWRGLLLGLSQYRAGAYEDAIRALTEAHQHPPQSDAAIATIDLLLAMSHHRLNQHDRARVAFERAERSIAALPTPDSGDIAAGGLPNWLICHVLHREAKALLAQ